MNFEHLYRQLTAFIFLAVFLTQSFSRIFLIADYYTNQKEYAGICENKAKPEMHCFGKCVLFKKISQENKKDQENPERKADNKSEIALSSKSFFATEASTPVCSISGKIIIQLTQGNITDVSLSIFHPPCL
ncbi:MAG TPA: hypothetical protein VMT76_07420 [Puia sp.]|nr:hypothetical protein [Puia sp.]